MTMNLKNLLYINFIFLRLFLIPVNFRKKNSFKFLQFPLDCATYLLLLNS